MTLHSLHGQLFGFHDLILCLKPTKESMFLISGGSISRILGPKYAADSVPL